MFNKPDMANGKDAEGKPRNSVRELEFHPWAVIDGKNESGNQEKAAIGKKECDDGRISLKGGMALK